jgi:hypothetical protein
LEITPHFCGRVYVHVNSNTGLSIETHAGGELRNSQKRESAAIQYRYVPMYEVSALGSERAPADIWAMNPQMGEPLGHRVLTSWPLEESTRTCT